MSNLNSKPDITYFALTNHRRVQIRFGLRQSDRRFHMYLVGKTGTGKSTLLKTMVLQDVLNGRGVALFDPHADLVEEVLGSLSLRGISIRSGKPLVLSSMLERSTCP